MLEGYKDVNRFEIIDYSPCKACEGKQVIKNVTGSKICPECQGMGCKGRTVIFWDDNKKVDVSLQDDNRTLKVFISANEQAKPSMALDDLIDDLEPTKQPTILADEPGTDELSENEA